MASSPAAVRELQQDLESQANALSKIQKGAHAYTHALTYIAKNHQVRKQYTIRLGENELVLTVFFPLSQSYFVLLRSSEGFELELLNENSNVYKLIGPVLVKQDIAEANANVRKRIEYISVELKRLDGTLQDSEDKQNSKKESVLQLQQKIQTLQAGKSKSYLPFVRTVQSFYLLSSSGYSSMLFPVKTFLPC
ncbi:unnamed protein product [Musa hybrid cultivar]